MTGMSNEDFTFATREQAEQWLATANEAWKHEHIEETGQPVLNPETGQIEIEKREYLPPKGAVFGVRITDELMEIDEEHPTHFAIISEDTEYMVPNYEPIEWILVA